MLEVHIENQKENVVVRDREYAQIVPKPLSPKGMEDVFAGRELTTTEQVGSGDLIRGVAPVFPLPARRRSSDSSRPAITFQPVWWTRST